MQRQTRQRRTIRSVLQQAGRPLSPTEILAACREELPRLGLATVYRNLKALVASEWLHVVELPGAAARYEVADKGHHHHFHCRYCDGVFEIDDCPGNLAALTPPGFDLEHHEVFLFGACPDCRQNHDSGSR